MNSHKGTDLRRGTSIVRDLSHESDRYLNAKPNFPSNEPKLRIIPLGGSQEIGGRNLTVIEYGKDILLVDMGLMFPEEDQPGVDYIIPNPTYLKGKEDNIRGVLITHGHMDHIGGIPQVMQMIGNPPIYATALTMALIQKKQTDNPMAPPLNAHVVELDKVYKFGIFDVEFWHINHSIPDSTCLVIRTPEGVVLHTGDYKIDHSPLGEPAADMGRFARLGNEGVAVFLADSTGAQKAGHAISETTIQHNIDAIFKQAKGKVIAATFSSLLNRIQQIIKISEFYGRKVVIEGYSMRTNIQIIRDLGYADFNPRTIISPHEATKLPPSQLTIISTGAQGEPNAALMRIANNEHKHFQIEKGDTVIFSSSVIPGNEASVGRLKDLIAKRKAQIIHYKMMDVHVGGHAPAEDLRMMIKLIRPKYIQPIYGDFYSLKLHGDIAMECGMTRDQVLLTDNGRVVEVHNGEARVTTEKVPAHTMMVDGLGVGDLGEGIIRDRQLLAQDGMLTVIAIIDSKKGDLYQSPEIVSKGFVYMKSSFKLIDAIAVEVKKTVKKKITKGEGINDEYVKQAIKDDLSRFIFEKTQRRPMIIPVVIEV
jgi:ribonuclease J